MAELATSSATYDTFGFVFEESGTYVFSSSCNPGSVIVLAVMGEDVRLATQHTLFVTPRTESEPVFPVLYESRFVD